MRAAAEEGAAPTLFQAAHALKGSSTFLGLVRLGATCEQLEALARAGMTDGALDLVEEVDLEVAKVHEVLERERRRWST